MNHNINLYFDVVLKNKNTKLNIEYSHESNNLYINAFNGNSIPLYLDDALESLRFSDDEIKQIKNFIKCKKVNLNETLMSNAKRENLKFFANLLYNHQYNITLIKDIILDVSTDDDTKVEITMDTDYSCTTAKNVAVTINESIKIMDKANNKILKTINFSDVNLTRMDKTHDQSNELFKTIFKDVNTNEIMHHISDKTVNYYLDAYNANEKQDYMYLALMNDETLNKLRVIKEKETKAKEQYHIIPLATEEELELKRIPTYFYTSHPSKVNTDIYDMVKAYPILSKKPTSKYTTKLIALNTLRKITQNIVENKL